MSSVFSQSYPCLPALQCQNKPNDVLLLVWCDDKRTMMIIIIMPRLTRYDDSHQHGDDALQAPPPAPLLRWTRLVSALAVVQDTTQPIPRSRGVSLRTTTQ